MNHKLRLIRLVLSFSSLLFVGVPESRAQDVVVNTIALSGDPGLSTGDPVIGVAGNVAIDSVGKVMFSVTTESNGTRTVNLATSNGTITSVDTHLDRRPPGPARTKTQDVHLPRHIPERGESLSSARTACERRRKQRAGRRGVFRA